MQYTLPTMGGITIVGAVAPDMGSADVVDKGSGYTDGDYTGAGYDATINMNPTFGLEALSGLNLFVGAHMTEHYNQTAHLNNRYEGVGGITLDIGPISLGYATSGISTGLQTATDVDFYKNHMYGIAFNINDDLSVSYGNHESQQGWVNPGGTVTNESVHMEVSSYQIAYSMGGASIRYAKNDVTNASYQTTSNFDSDSNVLSVSLAF